MPCSIRRWQVDRANAGSTRLEAKNCGAGKCKKDPKVLFYCLSAA